MPTEAATSACFPRSRQACETCEAVVLAGVEGACDRVTHSAQSAHTVMKPAPLHVVAAKDTVDSNRRLKVLEH